MKGIYDIHTHILPGVDDGAASMAESLQIIEDEVRQGVKGIVLTPHFRKHMFEPPESLIYSRSKLLLAEVRNRYPRLKVVLGCEFHAVPGMEEILRTRNFCTIGGTRTLLLEFSARHDFSFINEKTISALMNGYKPIIAHFERYPAVYDRLEEVERLKAMGARIQVNADSVLGNDGLKMKLFCRKLLKEEFVDFIASDVHNMTNRTSNLREAAKLVEKKYGERYAHKLFVRNPSTLFPAPETESTGR